MDICSIIKKAECCVAVMAHEYAIDKTFGNDDKDLLNNIMLMNAYIRTLNRNIPHTYKKKVPVSIEGSSVDFSSLKKENNVLILETEQKYECVEITSKTCLTDDDVCRIYENIKIICSNCNCNCN